MTNEELLQIIKEVARDNTKQLDLSNNQLSTLPPEISQLSNLTWLDLSNNQLSSLPPEFGQLSNLTWLDFSNNQLSSLPPEFGQLSKLRELSLSNNRLSSLPPEISQLSKLTWLFLNNNPQLTSPTPEIVDQGVQAILTYLRKELQDNPPIIDMPDQESFESGSESSLPVEPVHTQEEVLLRSIEGIFIKIEQERIYSLSPNVFLLRPRGVKAWKKNLTGQKLDLQLYCEAPGCWHPTQEGGLYEINEPAEWLRATAPYIGNLFKVLKYVAPIIGPWLGVVDPKEYETMFKNNLELLKELVAKLPEPKEYEDLELADKIARREDLATKLADGAALRALRELLKVKDPDQQWGGLKNVWTPKGHSLWLCEHHAAEYKH